MNKTIILNCKKLEITRNGITKKSNVLELQYFLRLKSQNKKYYNNEIIID